jgi:XTP/dITP diphosphohydrolase
MSSSRFPQVVLASRNRKKSGEIAELLAPTGIVVVSVAEFSDVPEVVEDGRTFAENAAKKAVQTARHLDRWVIGEDSGLMVDALGGAPGIYSARYSGEHATDEQNNEKLLASLANVPEDHRGAAYVCHVALADPAGAVRLQVESTCRGRIAATPRGSNGFGYDPLFVVREYHRTFGELSSVVKRQISHRARAFAKFIPQLAALFQQEFADPGTNIGPTPVVE